MLTLMQDLKFALRMLVKNPGFTLVAVLTLALGIGANSVIFSVVDAVMLRPLPYQEPSQLVYITGLLRQSGTAGGPISFTKFTQLQEQSRTLESSAAFYGTTLSLVTGREPDAIFFRKRMRWANRMWRSSLMVSGTATSRAKRARWGAS